MRRSLCLAALVAFPACAAAFPSSPSPRPAALPQVAKTPASSSPSAPPPSPELAPASAIAASDSDPETADDSDDLDDLDDAAFVAPFSRQGLPPAAPHPLASLDDRELERRFRHEPASLGPASIGNPGGGYLLNSIQMPPGPHWDLIDASHCYGTQETVDFLSASIETVNTKFPDTPKLAIGHISARSGGHLLPHVSHQAGRDVDLGYYYSGSQAWFTNATVENLDAPRTWALIRTFLTDTDVEMILVDRSVQRILRAYALSIGEDRGWIDSVIQIGGTGATPIVRHARRHRNHMHVRFFSPIAQETGRRLAAILGRKGLIPRPTNYVSHKARKGETLAVLAHRYGTSIGLIAQSNGIQGGRVQIGRVYRIPRAASVSNDQSPVLVPPRAVPSAAFHPN